MTITSLVFDFDGTLLDTETPEFYSCREEFSRHGAILTLDWWSSRIGGAGADPYLHLEALIGRDVDKTDIRSRRRPRHMALIEQEAPRPGVMQWIADAQSMGLSLAIASTSHRPWVQGHLERIHLLKAFGHVVCGDDVARVKPAPDLYELALRRLGATSRQAIAIEDSPNGIAAAKAAGLFCIAVPNPLTESLDLSGADLKVSSLAAFSLVQALSLV